MSGGALDGPGSGAGSGSGTALGARAGAGGSSPGPVIAVDGLVKRYRDGDGREREVLTGIDLRIGTGEVFGLLGPNGAGKTTLVETIAGLRTPGRGTVRVAGLDPAVERERVTRLLAVQPQAAALFPTLSAGETLELFASFYDDPIAPAEILRTVGLDGAERTRVKHLSGGQARRLLIGVALIGRPRIVILDEPSAGLDPAARRELWRVVASLRERSVTVLLTTHHMEEATELCDRLAILAAGRIVAEGSPEELTERYAAESEVRFAVPSDTDRDWLVATFAAALPEVVEAPGGLLVRLRGEDPDALLRAVTFTRGLRASGVAVRRPTLEDVYLDLTRTGPEGSR